MFDILSTTIHAWLRNGFPGMSPLIFCKQRRFTLQNPTHLLLEEALVSRE